MSRVIHTDPPGNVRRRILQFLALALEHLAKCKRQEEKAEVLAFMVLALRELDDTIARTTASWEKRGYWLKADRFRADWEWVSSLRRQIEAALGAGDIALAAAAAAGLESHVAGVKIPRRIMASSPWAGALERWRASIKDT